MRKSQNRIKTHLILISLIFIFIHPVVSFPYQGQAGVRNGLVLIVNDERGFFFVNLGRDEVNVGDLVEVYRKSERIATASIKRVMKKMSEASIAKSVTRINIGDSVLVTKPWKRISQVEPQVPTIAQLREKIRQLEEEKPVEKKLETLEEARGLAKRAFKAQLTFLEESKKKAVEALDKKLKTLKDKKAETRTRLETKIASLKHAKESIDEGLVPARTVRDETLDALDGKLKALERSKEDMLADLRQEIEELEETKLKAGVPVKPRPKILKEPEYIEEKAEKRLEELEERLKKKVVKYKLPEGPPDIYEKERLTLEDCLSIAMENHLPLKIAKKQLRLAEMRVIEAGRDLGPEVSLTGELTDGRVTGRYYDGGKIAIEAKQPIFYGGELVNSVKQAKVNLEIVKNDYDRVKNDLILQVKKGYYSLDKAEKALEIQISLHGKTEEVYNVTRTGYDAGVISQVELLKVTSQHNQTNFQVSSAEEDASIANLILQQAMNVDREVKILPLAEPRIVELGLRDCFELAYLNRPEMKISQLSLEHYEYEKKIMEARAYYPRVDLLGMYGNSVEDFIAYDIGSAGQGGGLDHPRTLGPEHYIGTTVSLPIWGSTFDYSFTKEEWTPIVRTQQATKSNTHEFKLSFLNKLEDFSSLSEAELEYMRSQDDLNTRKQEITLEVKEMFFKYKKAVFMMDVAESKLEFQKKQTNITDIRRELGEAQYSDVLDERIRLAEEEFSYLQAISDYYIAVASLNKAVGLDNHFEI